MCNACVRTPAAQEEWEPDSKDGQGRRGKGFLPDSLWLRDEQQLTFPSELSEVKCAYSFHKIDSKNLWYFGKIRENITMNVMWKKSGKQQKIKRYLSGGKKKKRRRGLSQTLSLANVYTLIYKQCPATGKGIWRPRRGWWLLCQGTGLQECPKGGPDAGPCTSSLRLTWLQLRHVTFLHGSRGAVYLCINLAFCPIQPYSKGGWLVNF